MGACTSNAHERGLKGENKIRYSSVRYLTFCSCYFLKWQVSHMVVYPALYIMMTLISCGDRKSFLITWQLTVIISIPYRYGTVPHNSHCTCTELFKPFSSVFIFFFFSLSSMYHTKLYLYY